MDERLRVTGEQLIPTIAYGDAAGLPFEKHRPLGKGSITGLKPVETNPFIGQYPIGTWSDDTQLSLAVAEGLIMAKGFDLEVQAEMHVKALNHVKGDESDRDWIPPIVTTETQNGWGGSTSRAVERLMDGVSPHDSGEVGGAGNGVLMKLAPLVYWQYVTETPADIAENQVVEFTRLTHDDPAAVVTSLVHRVVLMRLLNQQMPVLDAEDRRKLYSDAQYTAHLYEKSYDPSEATSEILDRINEKVVYEFPHALTRDDILDAAKKHGFYAPETLLMAYGSFVLEAAYPHSVYRAVELGGDADSIGSLVATLCLFQQGQVHQPEDVHALYDYERLRRVSVNLTRLATE